MTTKVNTSSLVKMAESSEDKEAYQPTVKSERCRVGVGARLLVPAKAPIFFVEIVVNMCPACTKADLEFLERALIVLKTLEQKGYTLTCQDDNSILCEKLATEQTLQDELKEANGIVKKGLEKSS